MNRNLFGFALLAALILVPAGTHATVPPATSAASQPVACPEIYQPVCTAHQVQCIAAPCYPVYKTYSNSCFMNAEGAWLIHDGECSASETGPYKGGRDQGDGSQGGDTSGGTYTPPAGCTAWFDGCNSCSRATPNGPAMCTLMACTGETKPGYCRAYGTQTPPPPSGSGSSGSGDVSTSSPGEPIPVEPDGGIDDTPHQGFFSSIWHSITSWFSNLF